MLDLMESEGLFANINRRKKKGISRSKRNSTIDQDTYDDMQSWNESLDSPADIEWVAKTKDYWKARFKVGQNDEQLYYTVDIMLISNGGSPYVGDEMDVPVWEISFYLSTDDGDWLAYNKTNTGNSNTVFASVLQAIREWFSTVQPEAITLSATEEDSGSSRSSRKRLYRALLKRFLPSGWQAVEDDVSFWAAKDTDPNLIKDSYANSVDPDLEAEWLDELEHDPIDSISDEMQAILDRYTIGQNV